MSNVVPDPGSRSWGPRTASPVAQGCVAARGGEHVRQARGPEPRHGQCPPARTCGLCRWRNSSRVTVSSAACGTVPPTCREPSPGARPAAPPERACRSWAAACRSAPRWVGSGGRGGQPVRGGGGALEPEEASLSAPGPLAGRICMPPPPTSPSPGLGGEPPCVGLCRTCGSSRGPWRFTWESSTSG